MVEKGLIRIESRFKKEELPEEIINVIKLKIGLKRAFVLGVITYIEQKLDKMEDCEKREAIKLIQYLKSNFGFL